MNTLYLKLEGYLDSYRRVFSLQKNYRHPLYPNIIVPKGFRTDLGSIPKVFAIVCTPTEIAEAAVIHDYLYQFGIGTRKEADTILYRLCKERLSNFRSYMIYSAVRVGGAKHFGTNVYK